MVYSSSIMPWFSHKLHLAHKCKFRTSYKLPDPLTLFLGSVLALFKVHSLTTFWVIIWLLGVLFIIRKHLYVER